MVGYQVITPNQHREPKVTSGTSRTSLMKFERLVALENKSATKLANLHICGSGVDNANFSILSLILTNSFDLRLRCPSLVFRICRIVGQLLLPFKVSNKNVIEALILLRCKLVILSFTSRCLYGVIL